MFPTTTNHRSQFVTIKSETDNQSRRTIVLLNKEEKERNQLNVPIVAGVILEMTIPTNFMLFNVVINPTITSGLKIIVRDGCVTHAESSLEYQRKLLPGFVKIVWICI